MIVPSPLTDNDRISDTLQPTWETSGELFAVQIIPNSFTLRGRKYHGHLVRLLMEDDEVWHNKAVFDSAWLDELIAVLQDARARLGKEDGDAAHVTGT